MNKRRLWAPLLFLIAALALILEGISEPCWTWRHYEHNLLPICTGGGTSNQLCRLVYTTESCISASPMSFKGVIVRKILACAAALAGFAAAAHAADLSVDSVKDPLPDTLSWHGVTLYGTIDVGAFYSTNSAPVSGAWYNGGNYTIYGAKYTDGDRAAITNNALEQSKVGLKIEEDIGYGFQAIGKLETGFNPASGQIADACQSLIEANGKLYSQMATNGDGSRCGQAFNGAAYGGLSSPLYGTLTFGRQNSLVQDGMGTYDPMALSYAFSLIGASGTPGAGIGSTETARWNDAVKYVFSYGPFHAAGMYTDGGSDTPILGYGYGANAGITYGGFSIDGFYTLENAAVNATFFNNPAYTTNPYTTCAGGPKGSGDCANQLLGTITNNEAWDVMAKYTFDVGGVAASLKDAPCGGMKDAPCAPVAKVTLFTGYQYTTLSNPDHAQSYYNGDYTGGGYQLYTLQNFLKGGAADDIAYGSNRVLETAWAGAKYEAGPWAFTGAYYWWHQNDYIYYNGNNCAVQTGKNIAAVGTHQFVGSTVATNCSGDLNQGSFLIDYTFNKHFDVYTGVTFSELGGGLASGFLQNNDTSVVSGLRIKF